MRLLCLLPLFALSLSASAQGTYLLEGTGVAVGIGSANGSASVLFDASLVTLEGLQATVSAVTGFGDRSAGNAFGLSVGLLAQHQHRGDGFTFGPSVGLQQVEGRSTSSGQSRNFSYTAATVGAEVGRLARVDSYLTLAPVVGASLAFPFRGDDRPALQFAVGASMGTIFESVAPRLVVEPGLSLGGALGGKSESVWAVTLALRILPGSPARARQDAPLRLRARPGA